MSDVYKISYTGKNHWKLPLNVAIGFHIVVAASYIYLPGMLDREPPFPEIYSVNLINIVEPAPQPEPPAPAATPPQQKVIEKPAPEKAVPIVKPKAPPAPKKIISLKPKKKKVIKKIPPAPKKDLSRIRAKEEAIAAQREADEAIKIAEEEAAIARKMMQDSIAQKNLLKKVSSKPAPTRNSGNTNLKQLSAVKKQYYNAVQLHIQSHWKPPGFISSKKSSRTQVYLVISRNGKIKDWKIENSSGDTTFDNFVKKAILSANPLPAIPSVIKEDNLGIGFFFNPEGIQNN